MRMTELIEKKRGGGTLSDGEIRWMIDGYTRGDIPDYQMSAMCMAVCFCGMTDEETFALTMSMLDSGERLDLSEVEGVKADKHSTGGVGDKTSLVLCPMLAACGVKVAKLSGRGLGHTGGTLDKLESFAGFSAAIDTRRLVRLVNENGLAIAGQTENLVPADKKLYALRDVTGTVSSIPLIVSSILSKKLAAGADIIVLDVKAGSGAFMQTEEDAFRLAEALAAVGRRAGKKVAAVVTDMDQPLGHAVGNALEVKEAISALRGEYTGDLTELCLALGTPVLLESGLARSEEEGRAMLQRTIRDGSAMERFSRFIAAQGGDAAAAADPSLLPRAPATAEAICHTPGYVRRIDARGVGMTSMALGGGRARKGDSIDLSVGVVLRKKVGERVAAGESLGVVHARTEEEARRGAERLAACFELTDKKIQPPPFIKGVVRRREN